MHDIAEKYYDKTGVQMSEESHLSGHPWELTWDGGVGAGKFIDFDLDIEKNMSTDTIDMIRNEQKIASQAQEIVDAL